jgi:hypothetical protein
MKKYSLFSILCIVALAQCACSRAATPTATKLTSADVYTAIAVTLTAKATSLPVVVAPSATPSPTPDSGPALDPSPTEIPTVATAQVVNAALVSNSSACDSSAFVSDVTIPDGTVIAPGQTFVKTWLLRNAGTCTWSKSYYLTFVSGDDLDGVETLIGQSVSPGGQAKVSVSLTAPDSYATYTGYWRLANASGVAFGASFWVKILVSDDAATVTSTPTATAETSTPTSTSEATATSIATAALTATPAPTSTPLSTSTPLPTAIPASTDTPAPASESSSTPTVAVYP